MNQYQVVIEFERKMAEFVGSKHAIAVDSCSNAIFLCAKYLNVDIVDVPRRTYISVPWSIINAGGKVRFTDESWAGSYELKPYNIVDSACMLSKGMYKTSSYCCVSFSANKILNIGKGGMIFTDNDEADRWFRLYRYEGREECPLSEQQSFIHCGYNMYMTPEQAARGLSLLPYLMAHNIKHNTYPDLKLKCAHSSILP